MFMGVSGFILTQVEAGLSPGGCMWQRHAWQGHAWWGGMHGRGAYMARGHTWQVGMHVGGGVCGRDTKTALQQTVRILLECIVVVIDFT